MTGFDSVQGPPLNRGPYLSGGEVVGVDPKIVSSIWIQRPHLDREKEVVSQRGQDETGGGIVYKDRCATARKKLS